MIGGLEPWQIAVIAAGGILFIILFIVCIYKYCRRNNEKNQFRWIDRMGIPMAKEGQPTEEEISRSMKRKRVNLKKKNGGYEQDIEVGRPREDTELEDPEPFKRLNKLGIPRARLDLTPVTGKKAPSTPLPSPRYTEDSSSSDEDDIASYGSNGS